MSGFNLPPGVGVHDIPGNEKPKRKHSIRVAKSRCEICHKPQSDYPNWIITKGHAMHVGCMADVYHDLMTACEGARRYMGDKPKDAFRSPQDLAVALVIFALDKAIAKARGQIK